MGKDTPSVSLKEQYTQSDIPQHVRVHVRFQMIQNARAENTLSQKDGERFIILHCKLSLFFQDINSQTWRYFGKKKIGI